MGENTEKTRTSENETDYLWRRRHEILHRLEVSVLYHRARERFLSWVAKGTTAVAIVGGSAAFAAAVEPEWLRWAGLVVAATSTLTLVFGVPERARLHGELAVRHQLLLAEIAAKGERDFTEADLNAWEAALMRIESEEPAAFGTLVRLCQNRLKRVAGHPCEPVPAWKRWTAHLIDHSR